MGIFDQPDARLSEILRKYSKNKYDYYFKNDFRPIAEGDSGNCARFTASYLQDLDGSGIKAKPVYVKNWNGDDHVVAVTDDGWVLDNREKYPRRIDDYNIIQDVPESIYKKK